MAKTSTIQTIGISADPSSLFPDGRNRLILGDCLETARLLPAESFDTIYLDPPFFTGKDFHLHNGDPGSVLSYSDSWAGGLKEYLAWLEARLAAMRDLLKPQGAFFLHLDWHAVHYAKVLLDGLFGMRNFQNEFIWYYSGGGASKKRFARKHDSILYYTKSDVEWKFYADRVRTPHKWTRGQRRADGSERDYTRGKLADDVWEHHGLMPWAEENVGYPTQKPLALLRRLLAATTDAGDVVGDFVCGSGATALAAQELGRRWVAADISRIAVSMTAERLAEKLVPGCIEHTTSRARARAAARHAAIVEDEERIGLDAKTLAACMLVIQTDAGFTVEQVE